MTMNSYVTHFIGHEHDCTFQQHSLNDNLNSIILKKNIAALSLKQN